MNTALRIRRLLAATITGLAAAFVLVPVVSATSTDPEPSSHVSVTDNALDPNFVPLPGQHGLPEQTFLNEVREEGVTGSDKALLAVRADTCQGILNGLTPEMLAGLHDDRYGARQAEVLTVAAVGTCGGSVLAEQMP